MKNMINILGSYSAAAFVAILLAFPGTAFAIAGKFEFVNGQVQIIDATGAQHTVNKGDVINQGDTISASANGFAQVKMEDGGFFAVRPDTQFRIDTFNFNGKEDGTEKGIFSLIKGSLRSVTGLIGKVHRDNYKIVTATSTIGIRGSGADVGNDDAIGTAVHTLFGGHTLTSHGQTIETRPGQTALAAPGQAPKFVPSFPFNTSTSPGDKQGNGSTGNNKSQAGNNNTANKAQPDSTPGTTQNNVVVPIVTTDGINLTTNTTSSGTPITSSDDTSGAKYIHFMGAILDTGGSSFVIAEEGSNKTTYPFSNYTFSSNGALIGVANSSFSEYNADEFSGTPNEIVSDMPSSFVITGGTVSDLYHTPDNSLFIGRSRNTVAAINCRVCSGSDTFVNSVFIVGLATAPSLVQTLTGSTTYNLVGSTHPTDGFGNVGTLNSASLNANFINQTVSLGANLSINSKTLNALATGLPIVSDGFEATSTSGQLSVSCTGGSCGSGYAGDIGGKFFGNAAGTAGFEYLFWPSINTSGNFTDIIQGVAAFSASGTPTAFPSDPAPLGGGGSIVGLATYPSTSLFGGFNTVDNSSFSARLDANGDLVGFAVNGSGTTSASLGTASVISDGSDPALGVRWGRWGGGTYNLNEKNNNAEISAAPSGHLAFITGTQITTLSQLAAMPGLGITTASYTLASGSFPTTLDGVSGSHLTAASASVNFSSNTITSYSIAGTGSTSLGFNNWSASGSGSIANFMSSTGISLSGSCSGGAGGCTSGGALSGTATGGFVGAQAQGLISTFGLNGPGGTNIAGAVYMKR
ncbi:MAG TPA: hypothetical protein VIE17_11075 [Methylophilaceae bacterium]|jgi:hypothetical protein